MLDVFRGEVPGWKGSYKKQQMKNCILRDFCGPLYVTFLPVNFMIMLYGNQNVFDSIWHCRTFWNWPSCEKKPPGQSGTISLFSVGLKFHPKMKDQVCCLSTGYINYISVLTNSVLLQCLLIAQKNISIPSAVKLRLHCYCDTSYSRGGVNQMWILINTNAYA